MEKETKYLFIFEDGVVRKSNEVHPDDLSSSNDGYLQIIRLSDLKTHLMDDQWVDLGEVIEMEGNHDDNLDSDIKQLSEEEIFIEEMSSTDEFEGDDEGVDFYADLDDYGDPTLSDLHGAEDEHLD